MESLHPNLRDIIIRFFGEVGEGEPKSIRIISKQSDTPISQALSFGEGKFLFIAPINANTISAMKNAIGGSSSLRPKVLIVVKGGKSSGDEKIPSSWNVRRIPEEQVSIRVLDHVFNGGSSWPWNSTSEPLSVPSSPSMKISDTRNAIPGIPIAKASDPVVAQLAAKPGDCVEMEISSVIPGEGSTRLIVNVRR